MKFHATLAIGSGRFDFPGYLPQLDVERGAYAYGTTGPAGRDRTSQTLIGVDFTFEGGSGTIGLGAFGDVPRARRAAAHGVRDAPDPSSWDEGRLGRAA